MREILFRGKRTDNGEWVKGDLIHSLGRTYCGIYAETLEEVDPKTVGQYTGLTDKNGKKIFEGDIVQTSKYGKDNGNGQNFSAPDLFVVEFSDGGFCLKNEWRRFNLRPDVNIEIIGNVYDNPELLKGEMEK